MMESGNLADSAFVSPSVRTRQTFQIFQEQTGHSVKTEFPEDLYLPSPKTILSLTSKASSSSDTLIVVAHNPGLHETVLELLMPSSLEIGHPLNAAYPTAAAAVITLPINAWTEIKWGIGMLKTYMDPKRLKHSLREA